MGGGGGGGGLGVGGLGDIYLGLWEWGFEVII